MSGLELKLDQKPDTAIILFHGFGASCDDLAPLAPALNLKTQVDWFFPDGFLEVPIGPMMSGRAWFYLDLEYLANPAQDIRDWTPSQQMRQSFEDASEKVKAWLSEISKNYSKVIVGGFSQGSMMVCDQVFKHQSKFDSMMILSGSLVPERGWESQNEFPQINRIFHSHGKQDPVLAYAGGEALSELIKDKVNPLHYEFHSFEGGHEIPHDVLISLKHFIEEGNS